MTHTDPETVPPIWQVGDLILDRYEVQQIFTDGGISRISRIFAEFVEGGALADWIRSRKLYEGGPEQASLRSPVRRLSRTKNQRPSHCERK